MKTLWFLITCAAAAFPGWCANSIPRPNFLPPPYPAFAVLTYESGSMVIAIHFDQDGGVDKCVVTKNSAPDNLADYTVRFIRNHWRYPSYAGRSIQVPIIYEMREQDFPPPSYPSFAAQKHESGTITLDVHFDMSGNIDECAIKETSAPRELAEFAALFIKGHWHHKSFAGRSMEFPVTFQLRH